MEKRTSQLNYLVKSLGIILVVEKQKAFVANVYEALEESLTLNCLQTDLKDGIGDIEVESGY
jgi:hypothetical protein